MCRMYEILRSRYIETSSYCFGSRSTSRSFRECRSLICKICTRSLIYKVCTRSSSIYKILHKIWISIVISRMYEKMRSFQGYQPTAFSDEEFRRKYPLSYVPIVCVSTITIFSNMWQALWRSTDNITGSQDRPSVMVFMVSLFLLYSLRWRVSDGNNTPSKYYLLAPALPQNSLDQENQIGNDEKNNQNSNLVSD